jgi:hypothetical protein
MLAEQGVEQEQGVVGLALCHLLPSLTPIGRAFLSTRSATIHTTSPSHEHTSPQPTTAAGLGLATWACAKG